MTTDPVAAYAAAKSRADAEEALRHCTDDLLVETVAFQTAVAGKEANRASFAAFFAVFPDYDAELEATVGKGELRASWGTLRATMRGPIGRIAPTGRRFELPFASVWRVNDDLIAFERFFFDLHQMCEQLELDSAAVLTEIRAAAAVLASDHSAAAA